MAEEEEKGPREIAPFQTIRRGDRWTSPDGDVTFTDFSPRVFPADAEVDDASGPKVSLSAPASAESSSQTVTDTENPEVTAEPLVVKDNGQLKVSEPSLLPSSNEQNPG